MADSLRISTATRDQTSQDNEAARDNATLKAGMPDYGIFSEYGKFGNFGKFGKYGQWGKYGTWGKYGKFGKLGAEGKFGESGGGAEEEEELGWWNSKSCESECDENADPWSEECYDYECYGEKCSEKCYFDDGPPFHPCEYFYPPQPWMEEEYGPEAFQKMLELERQEMKDVLDSDCYKCALCHDDDCWAADLECEVECYDECWTDGADSWSLLEFHVRRNSTQGPDAAAPSGKPLSAHEKAMAAHPKTGRLEFHQFRRMKAQKRKKEGKFGCGECFHACHEKKGDPCAWFGELEAPDLPPYYYEDGHVEE